MQFACVPLVCILDRIQVCIQLANICPNWRPMSECTNGSHRNLTTSKLHRITTTRRVKKLVEIYCGTVVFFTEVGFSVQCRDESLAHGTQSGTTFLNLSIHLIDISVCHNLLSAPIVNIYIHIDTRTWPVRRCEVRESLCNIKRDERTKREQKYKQIKRPCAVVLTAPNEIVLSSELLLPAPTKSASHHGTRDFGYYAQVNQAREMYRKLKGT